MPGLCLCHELIIRISFKGSHLKTKKRVFNGYPFLFKHAPDSMHGRAVLLVSGPKSQITRKVNPKQAPYQGNID